MNRKRQLRRPRRNRLHRLHRLHRLPRKSLRQSPPSLKLKNQLLRRRSPRPNRRNPPATPMRSSAPRLNVLPDRTSLERSIFRISRGETRLHHRAMSEATIKEKENVRTSRIRRVVQAGPRAAATREPGLRVHRAHRAEDPTSGTAASRRAADLTSRTVSNPARKPNLQIKRSRIRSRQHLHA